MATSNTPTTKRRRGSRQIHLLTQEELKRLFAVIKDKRDKALFLPVYRHELRASEIGLLFKSHRTGIPNSSTSGVSSTLSSARSMPGALALPRGDRLRVRGLGSVCTSASMVL